MPKLPCRLIIDDPLPAARNMAIDEALLQTCPGNLATLRFYNWSSPTLSLGYFQSSADRHAHPASLCCDLVRRRSGGGAILHDQELTYSFVAPTAKRFAADDWFLIIHTALISALEEFSISARLANAADVQAHDANAFLCFQRRSEGDVILGRTKIAGSAQKRKYQRLLQHGSILMKQSQFAPELQGILDLASSPVCQNELIRVLTDKLANQFSDFIPFTNWNTAERDATKEAEVGRFCQSHWTHRR